MTDRLCPPLTITERKRLRESYVFAITEIEKDRVEANEKYETALRVLRERLAALGDGETVKEK